MDGYALTVNIDDATLAALTAANASLVAFKAVSGPLDLAYTVWYAQPALASINPITWTPSYNIYNFAPPGAVGPPADGAVISPSNVQSMPSDKQAKVNADNTWTISPGSGAYPEGFYQFNNDTHAQIYCGLTNTCSPAVLPNAPICCETLYGVFSTALQPVEKVYLCFATTEKTVGSLWTTPVPGPTLNPEDGPVSGYFIDLTTPLTNAVSVTFNMVNGWSCVDATQFYYCTNIDSGTNLSSFLNAGMSG